jgi:hypothetical protein
MIDYNPTREELITDLNEVLGSESIVPELVIRIIKEGIKMTNLL